MPIKGISDKRRIPRDGKIKLGTKKVSQRTGKEYPVQTDYLVVPDPIKELYGERPKEIDIMFASDDEEQIFPQYYKCYGATGLKCKGDGITAMVMAQGELIHKDCTPEDERCRKEGCKPIATLKVLLPKIPGFGVWEINTSSWNSIVNLNSCIETIKTMTNGRISFIPLKLKYEPHTGQIYDKKTDKHIKKEVYVLSITVDETIENFYKRYRVPSPEEIPELARMIEVNKKFQMMLESKNKVEKPDACAECGNEIASTERSTSDQLIDYSVKHYGCELCEACLMKRYQGENGGGT